MIFGNWWDELDEATRAQLWQQTLLGMGAQMMMAGGQGKNTAEGLGGSVLTGIAGMNKMGNQQYQNMLAKQTRDDVSRRTDLIETNQMETSRHNAVMEDFQSAQVALAQAREERMAAVSEVERQAADIKLQEAQMRLDLMSEVMNPRTGQDPLASNASQVSYEPISEQEMITGAMQGTPASLVDGPVTRQARQAEGRTGLGGDVIDQLRILNNQKPLSHDYQMQLFQHQLGELETPAAVKTDRARTERWQGLGYGENEAYSLATGRERFQAPFVSTNENPQIIFPEPTAKPQVTQNQDGTYNISAGGQNYQNLSKEEALKLIDELKQKYGTK